MKTKDLRIGNYISYLGEPQEVLGMDKTHVYIKPFKFVLFLDTDEVGAIPITEDWLLNFGFKKSSEGFFCIKTNKRSIKLKINLKSKRAILFKNLNEIYVDLMMPKNVHQLQDLYFALTGDELKLI